MITIHKGKQRALVVAARFPGLNAPMAGHRICAAHIADLAKSYVLDLVVICRSHDDFTDLPLLRTLCERIKIISLGPLEALFNITTNSHLPLPVAARISRRAKKEFSQFASHHYELAHFEWTEMAIWGETVQASCKQIMCHDILTELFERRIPGPVWHRLFWSWQAKLARHYEATYLPNMATIFALSKADAADLNQLNVPSKNISIIGPEFYRCEPHQKPWTTESRKILIWGAFGRSENREAANILLREIMPKLSTDNIELLIAGSDSDKYYTDSSNVKVLGRVSSPSEVFQQAHVAVYPLYHGSGLKIKVLEALYAGIPVVTTSVGREGYECGKRDGLFLAESADEFALVIRELLTNLNHYQSAANSAAAWAKSFVSNSKFGVTPARIAIS